MSKGKAPFLPPALQRTNSEDLKQTLYTGKCIVSAVNYLRNNSRNPSHPAGLKAKLAATTYSTVVENLIELMKVKGYPKISLPNVIVLYNYLFMPIVDRKDIFNCIYKWAGRGDCPIPPKTMRSLLTFSSSLDTATQISVKESTPDDYFKTWDDISEPEIKLTAPELPYFKLVLQDKKGITLSSKIKPDVILKKKCSMCWLCGTPVYVFKYKTTILNTCGEDEHVLPPGIGNLSGLLEPTYKATIKHFHDSSLIQKGLRASHAWCNQAKSDTNFIKPPLVGKGTAKGWSLNQVGINEFLETVRQRLKPLSKSTAKSNYYYSYESMFQRNPNDSNIELIISKMKKTIEDHITDVCKEANKLVVPTTKTDNNNNTAYTSFIIRLIFNSCFIGKEYIFDNFGKKWKSFTKGGGVGGEGPEDLDSDLLNILCKEIMNEGENTCLDDITIEKFNMAIDVPDVPVSDVPVPVLDDIAFLEFNKNDVDNAFHTMNNELITEFRDINVKNSEGKITQDNEIKIGLPDEEFNEDYPALSREIQSVENFIVYDIEEEPVNVLSNISADEINEVVWNASDEEINSFKQKYLLRDTPERISWRAAQVEYEREKERLIETSELSEPEIIKLREKINRNKSSIRGIKMNINALKNSRELIPITDTDNTVVIQPQPGGTRKRKQLKTKKQKYLRTKKKKRKQTRNKTKRKQTRKRNRK